MFPNLWSGRPEQAPESEIRPVDSLSGLHQRALNEAHEVENYLDEKRKRILQQLKEVTNDQQSIRKS